MLLILISTFLISGPDTSTYPKFENEQVAQYRKVYDFKMPEIEGMEDIPLTPSGENHLSGNDNFMTDIPPMLDELMKRAKELGLAAQIDGYRIQIYAGGDLEEANKVRSDFLEKFPGYGAYRLWVQPTFRVRVGDFPTRNDAMIFSNQVHKEFPGAFVVPDKIEKPKIRKPVIHDEQPATPSPDGGQGE